MYRILAAPVDFGISTRQYGKSYNLLNNLEHEGYTIDAFVNNVNSPFESDTVNLHDMKCETKLGYYLSAFQVARSELRSDNVDLYHHMNLSYRWFNPLLLGDVHGDTPVIIGPSQTGHLIMAEEFQRFLTHSLGREIPQPVSDSFYSLFSATRDFMIDPVRIKLFQRTLQKADRIVVVHQEAKKVYSEFVDSSKLKVIPLGVNPTEFEYDKHLDSKDIVAIGSLRERKGYDILLSSLPDITKRHPDAHLHIFGRGPLEDKLRSKTRQLGVENNVTFHGYVEQSVVKDYLASAQIFVHPSRSESFSLVRLEAMAAGCPVVVSDIPGAREMVRDGREGYVLSPISPDQLVAPINSLLDNPETASRMGQQARSRVEEHYDWRHIGKQYLELYDELL